MNQGSITQKENTKNLGIDQIMDKNLVWIPLLIIFIYRMIKLYEYQTFNFSTFVAPSIFAIFLGLYSFLKKEEKLSIWYLYSLAIFFICALRFNDHPLNSHSILSFIFVLISFLPIRFSFLFFIPCFILNLEQAPFLISGLSYNLYKNKIIKKTFLKYITFVLFSMVIFHGFFSEPKSFYDFIDLIKKYFDELIKPLNIGFFIGIMLYYKRKSDMDLLLPLFFSTTLVVYENQILLVNSLLKPFCIGIMLLNFKIDYNENPKKINILLFTWLVFGGFF